MFLSLAAQQGQDCVTRALVSQLTALLWPLDTGRFTVLLQHPVQGLPLIELGMGQVPRAL